MPSRHVPSRSSSTDDEEENDEFMFDDENTIQHSNIRATCTPVVDACSQKSDSEHRERSFKSRSYVKSHIDVNIHDNSTVVKGRENAYIYRKLVELPWRAVFDVKNKKKNNLSLGSLRKSSSISNLKESVEKKRHDSGQKPSLKLNSSILRTGATNSKTHSSQKLQEDEHEKQKIPPLILESNSFRQTRKRSDERQEMSPSENDDVFYKNEGASKTHVDFCRHVSPKRSVRNHYFSQSPPIDPHGARKFGVSGYDDYRPSYERIVPDPEYYRRKREDSIVSDLCGRLKIWNRYSKTISADIAQLERVEKAKHELDVEERLARRMKEQLFPNSSAPSLFPVYGQNYNYLSSSKGSITNIYPYFNRQRPLSNLTNFQSQLKRPFPQYYDSSPQQKQNLKPDSPAEPPTWKAKQLYETKGITKAPFFGATKKNNQVSFSIPVNSQQLLNILKLNHPNFFTLAKRLIDKNPKCENLAEEFLEELGKRADRLTNSIERIEKGLKNAMGDRVDSLKRELDKNVRNLRVHIRIIEKLHDELELQHGDGCGNQIYQQSSNLARPLLKSATTHQSQPKDINGIKILHRVFEHI